MTDYICPYCGFDPLVNQNPKYLRVGVRLHNRYLVGKVLGEGGFGITYRGYDSIKNEPVAIKEHFPAAYVSRDMSSGRSKDVKVFDGKSGKRYEAGLESFRNEGNALKSLEYYKHVVQVKDFFEENNTGYIIMEYVPGITLYEWIADNGKMSCEEALSLMLPLMNDIARIHKKGLLHRDISPDNIILRPDGVVKLIDFGSARRMSTEKLGNEKSMTVFIRQQYTPKEQYLRRGNQGTWTDVYAMTATIYYLLTGVNPPPVLDREDISVQNDFKEKLGELTEDIAGIIEKGMAISIEERYKDFDQLAEAFKKLNIIDCESLFVEKTLYYDRKTQGKRVIPLRTKKLIRKVFFSVLLIPILLCIYIAITKGGLGISDKINILKKPMPTAVSTNESHKNVHDTTDGPTVTDEPAVTDEPTVTDEPVASDKPAVTDEPVVTDKAKAAVKPKVTKKPKESPKRGIQIITD